MIRVFLFVPYYLPGYKAGGPIRTIANMVERLEGQVKFYIITSDRDLGDVYPYQNVETDRWVKVGYADVYYTSSKMRLFFRLPALTRAISYDILYLNSFFNPGFAISPLIARFLRLLPPRPAIIAPRGQFSDGAIKLSRNKKRLYVFLSDWLRLCHGMYWQASSFFEAQDIVGMIRKVALDDVFIAPDIPSKIPAIQAGSLVAKSDDQPLRVCFLSRISPMKNLDFSLQVLQKVRVPIHFDIYGPIEDPAYWARCEDLICNLNPFIRAHYCGYVEHAQVPMIFAQYDLFFFPTRGENYGHVILESMIAGTPVLLSNTTPWRDLQTAGVGWDLPLDDHDPFVHALEEAAIRVKWDYEWRDRVHAYAERISSDMDVLKANVDMFRKVLQDHF